MKIDGKHPLRQKLREEIRYVEQNGSITMTANEFKSVILRAEELIPKAKRPTTSWKGNR